MFHPGTHGSRTFGTFNVEETTYVPLKERHARIAAEKAAAEEAAIKTGKRKKTQQPKKSPPPAWFTPEAKKALGLNLTAGEQKKVAGKNIQPYSGRVLVQKRGKELVLCVGEVSLQL